jgi:tRNA 2-thiouridine synthesizing protein E
MSTHTLTTNQVQTDEEGFLVNPDDWTEEIAVELAKTVEIEELTEMHWKVIRFMREDYKAKGQIPTIRRIKNAGGVTTKDLYTLFPNGPAKKAALISGLGKPQGCV